MVGAALRQGRESIEQRPLRVGFVPLIDAAPLIAADRLGYFRDEHLDVRLQKQIGWGNVRDRLTYGELDASHGPIGMAPASHVPLPSYDQPLAIVMGISTGGNAITIAKRLADRDVSDHAPLTWRQRLGRPMRLAYVASVGTHHFALRDLLQRAGLELGRDAELCVVPPAQMPGLLARGVIDGFCAGEPWNTLAEIAGSGSIYRATTQWTADHPEKALLVSRRWHAKHEPVVVALIRAVLRGCDFCEREANRSALAEILARPEFLSLDETAIAQSLSIGRRAPADPRRPRFRSFDRASTAPRVERVAWVVKQMARWGVVPADADVPHLAHASVLPDAYDRAASTVIETVTAQPDPHTTAAHF